MACLRDGIFSHPPTTQFARRLDRIQAPQPFLPCHSRRLWMRHLYVTRHFLTTATALNFYRQSVFTMEYLISMLFSPQLRSESHRRLQFGRKTQRYRLSRNTSYQDGELNAVTMISTQWVTRRFPSSCSGRRSRPDDRIDQAQGHERSASVTIVMSRIVLIHRWTPLCLVWCYLMRASQHQKKLRRQRSDQMKRASSIDDPFSSTKTRKETRQSTSSNPPVFTVALVAGVLRCGYGEANFGDTSSW
ncbi:hypothetical protein C8J56DRAFT_279798 [Mycena floridula]|nr:hypothetical protein C8J56DRAFT_279798 [Mycena floridula]